MRLGLLADRQRKVLVARLGLLADRQRKVLVGARAVAPLAEEWIHQPALAVKVQNPLEVLRDTVGEFPTFSEAYLKGVERLDA